MRPSESGRNLRVWFTSAEQAPGLLPEPHRLQALVCILSDRRELLVLIARALDLLFVSLQLAQRLEAYVLRLGDRSLRVLDNLILAPNPKVRVIGELFVFMREGKEASKASLGAILTFR